MVGASEALGCGGQSPGDPGGRVQVEEWASWCFAWQMSSFWSETECGDQHYQASGSTREVAAEHTRCPAVQPCVCRGSGQGSAYVLSVCIGSCAPGVAGGETGAGMRDLKLLEWSLFIEIAWDQLSWKIWFEEAQRAPSKVARKPGGRFPLPWRCVICLESLVQRSMYSRLALMKTC